MICLTGGDFLGWFKLDEIYNFSNNINSAVYAFAITEKVPSKNLLPFNLEETFYIGETGGQQPTWDQKDKDTGRGRLQTSFHNRMKAHSTSLLKRISQNLPYGKIISVAIFVPKKTNLEDYNKHWQKSCESELIYLYGLMFGKTPDYNLAHQSKNSKKRIKENSISNNKIIEIESESVLRWMKND